MEKKERERYRKGREIRMKRREGGKQTRRGRRRRQIKGNKDVDREESWKWK